MGARILVIDDYETIRKLLTCNLQIRGYQVFSYDYAHLDLTVLQQFKPDLIILDLNICNDGCGRDFLQSLKMQETTANIPILITTTLFPLPADIQNAIFIGKKARLAQAFPSFVVDVLPKPFEVSHLLRAVEKYAQPGSRHASLSLNRHAVIRFDTRKKYHDIASDDAGLIQHS